MQEGKSFSKESLIFFRHLATYFQNNSWLLLSIVFAGGILLRLPNLTKSLWFDELWATRIKNENILWLGNNAFFDIHPPFYQTFIFFWIRLFGDSEISVRMPSLISGILSIFLVYTLSSTLAGKRTALIATFLLCLSPVHIWYSQEARSYSLTLCLLLVSILSYYKLKEHGTKSIWYVIYCVSLCVAVLSHYFVIVYLMSISMMCLIKINKVKRNVLILNVLIVASLIVFLALKYMFANISTGQEYLRSFTLFELWRLFFSWFLSGNSLAAVNQDGAGSSTMLQRTLMLLVQIWFLGIFLRGLVLIFKQSKQKKEAYSTDVVLYVFALPLLLLGLSFSGFENIYIERSALWVLPFFYLVLAKGLTEFRTRPITIASVMFAVLFSTTATSAFFQKSDVWTVYKPNPDWYAAARYFDDEIEDSSDNLVAFATTPASVLTYYDSQFTEVTDLEDTFLQRIEKAERFLGAENILVRLLSLEVEKYIRFVREREARGRLGIHYLNDDENIHNTLVAKNKLTFYLIHNRY